MIPFAAALLLGAALSAAPVPTAVAGSGCRTTDLMPAFWTFWEKARDRSATEQ